MLVLVMVVVVVMTVFFLSIHSFIHSFTHSFTPTSKRLTVRRSGQVKKEADRRKKIKEAAGLSGQQQQQHTD